MTQDKIAIDDFISRLYRAWGTVALPEFHHWVAAELCPVVEVDAMLWGTGCLSNSQFHFLGLHGLDSSYVQELEGLKLHNPLLQPLLQNKGCSLRMSQVWEDERFFASNEYNTFCTRFGIERILCNIILDERSDLLTLLSWYRFDRERDFTDEEARLQERLVRHLCSAARNAAHTHMAIRSGTRPRGHAAICDAHGHFVEAESGFLDLLDQHFPGWKGQALPFDLPAQDSQQRIGALCMRCEALGDFSTIYVWPHGPLDNLDERERKVCDAVAQGMSYKQIAKRMELAPSTVSNCFYGVLDKLQIHGRSELVELMYKPPSRF